MSEVESLRQQLRERGYLTHGIERWFALDPWSSRAFWLELLTVAFKAGVLIALFAALPMAAIMLLRNPSAGAPETLALFGTYAVLWAALAGSFIVAVALVMKLRPAIAIDTPRALLAISIAAAALLLTPFAIWWYRFDVPPSLPELGVGTALAIIFFLVATVVVSAALLSFSIYELQRIPAIHQKSRVIPIGLTALGLVGLLFVPAYTRDAEAVYEPMVVTRPSSHRVALIGVDGLTHEILMSRNDLRELLPSVHDVTAIAGSSTAERWASLATGVPTLTHGVRSLEGIRFPGAAGVLQNVSRADVALMHLAPSIGIARREPLPPTVRRRDYIWEIFAKRGLPSASINWWATADATEAALVSVAPDSIFARSRGIALEVDSLAAIRLREVLDRTNPRFVAIYLPALDVILNRAEGDSANRLARSMQALDGVAAVVSLARDRGFEVVVAGLPGDGQSGAPVLASTRSVEFESAWDVAPTLLTRLGFPPSQEMPGKNAGDENHAPIATYGSRRSVTSAPPLNEEYYENLRSLGYIQ